MFRHPLHAILRASFNHQGLPMYRTLSLTLALTVGLAACATPPAETQTAQGDPDICKMETPTGSNVVRKVCKTASVREAEQRAAAENGDAMRHARRTGPDTSR